MTLLGNQFPGLMDQLQHPPPSLSLNIATSMAFDISNSSSAAAAAAHHERQEENEQAPLEETTLDNTIDISNGISSYEHVLQLRRYQLLERLSANWFKHGREYHDVMYQMNTISQQLMQNIVNETRSHGSSTILYPTVYNTTRSNHNPFFTTTGLDVRTFSYPTATSILGRFVTDNNNDTSSLFPNIRQILSATEIYHYQSETSSDRTCPITLEEFEEGEELCRIRSCRHVFTWKYLQEWFCTNSHCPVCRYDIRTYRPPTTPPTTE